MNYLEFKDYKFYLQRTNRDVLGGIWIMISFGIIHLLLLSLGINVNPGILGLLGLTTVGIFRLSGLSLFKTNIDFRDPVSDFYRFLTLIPFAVTGFVFYYKSDDFVINRYVIVFVMGMLTHIALCYKVNMIRNSDRNHYDHEFKVLKEKQLDQIIPFFLIIGFLLISPFLEVIERRVPFVVGSILLISIIIGLILHSFPKFNKTKSHLPEVSMFYKILSIVPYFVLQSMLMVELYQVKYTGIYILLFLLGMMFNLELNVRIKKVKLSDQSTEENK